MDNKEKSPEQELIESISLMLDKGLETNTDVYTGILKSINGKKAVVTMNGQDQNVAVVSPDLLAGMATRVFVPNGNMSNAFIIGGGSGQASSGLQFSTGSYVGTGVLASPNKKSLSFNFSPKFMVITTKGASELYTTEAIFIYGSPIYWCTYNNSTKWGYKTQVTWGDKSISWACYAYSDSAQLNENGSTYYYFAIGF